ncbi:MAG TPA: DUF5666 domain-containing protein [Steroidobacteraceae bacterium]|nr:DUF5666 domain-containing protein [Steroidobacteraceae bacterium]
MLAVRVAVFGLVAACIAGCGGSGAGTAGNVPAASTSAAASTADTATAPGSSTGTGSAPAPASHAQAPVPLMLSADASRNWAKVAVRILSISLTPQGGGAPVTVYSAPSPAPAIDLEQLDHISQLLGNVSAPPGSYTGAVITVGANPGDVALTSSDDPDSGFAAPLSAAIPAQSIKVQNSQGGTGAMSAAIPVTLPTPYVVSATAAAQAPLELDFPVSNPAFVQAQTPVTDDPTLWAVDFQGAVTGKVIPDITSLVLRQMYGTLTAVSADGKSLNITRDYPAHPIADPETAVATAQPLTILADAGNGTQFYDIDAASSETASNFVALAGLSPGRYLRISARYQADGSLVATRIWASNVFSGVWAGPEGHVTQVDAGAGTLSVEDESGNPVRVQTDAGTEFDYHGTPIATGSAFLATGHIVRGFEVHVSPRAGTSGPMVAQSIDIESALFWGAISNTTLTGFTYTSQFSRDSDNYTLPLSDISPSTPNGTAATGTPITGFDYWNFAYPTEIVYGDGAVADFQLATSGSVTAYGLSPATWNDPAAPSAWALRATTLLPGPLGLATVTTGLVSSGYTSTFSLTPVGDSTPITVQLITASGSAPLVYQLDRDHSDVAMTPLDITTASGLAQLSAALTPGAYVNVFAIPKSSAAVQAYTLLYYTGIHPRPAAPHQGNTCNGSFDGFFAGSITVAAGEDCTFSSGATVEGNIKVTGGTLELSGARVKGNVQVQGAGTVSILAATHIEGNLQIQDLPSGSAAIQICGAAIDRNLQYQNNGAAVTIGGDSGCAGNTIGGNLQINDNSAPAVILDNAVSGNLQCENDASVSGGGNSARKKQGQCASL